MLYYGNQNGEVFIHMFSCQDVIMNKYTHNKYKYIKNRYMLAINDPIIKKMSKERCGYGVK